MGIGQLQEGSSRTSPDDVHRALQDRAEHRGHSLHQYLGTEVTRLAGDLSENRFSAAIDDLAAPGTTCPVEVPRG